MLSELFIRNFAIIDELRLRLNPGFNVLTGETGAGKSIILDAVTLVLGERADTTVIRAGTDEAYVEATFRLDEGLQAELRPILEAEGLDEEGAEFVVLAVNFMEARSDVAAFTEGLGITFPVALDPDGKINGDLYRSAIPGYPTSLLLDADGIIAAYFPGSLSGPELLAALNDLRTG